MSSSSEVDVASQFVVEADGAIRASAEVEAVDPDVAVGHYAVEDNEYMFGSLGWGKAELFAVPSNARWEEASALAGGIGLSDGPSDGPVVRDAQ